MQNPRKDGPTFPKRKTILLEKKGKRSLRLKLF